MGRDVIISILAALLAVCPAAASAVTLPADSVAAADSAGVSPRLNVAVPVTAGTVMLAGGIAGHAFQRDARVADGVNVHNHFDVVEVGQYVPLALPWVLKAAGVKTRSGWGRMAVSQAMGTALMAGTVYTLKHTVRSPRPDGSDNRSFPSGHTAWAFMGATMAAHELAGTSPWSVVGAYTVASGIAVQRVVAGRHYPVDVVAGAGVGILTAQLGYYIGDLIFRDRQLCCAMEELERENANLSFLSLQTGMYIALGRVGIGDGKMIRLPALAAAFQGGVALGDNWGVRAELGLVSTPLQIEQHLERTQVASLNSLGVIVSPYYRLPLSRLVSLNAEAGAGYYHNFGLNSIDKAITAKAGTPAGRVAIGVEMRLDRNFNCKASVGYEVSSYGFTIEPSEAYGITRRDHVSGVTSSLLLGLSSAITF